MTETVKVWRDGIWARRLELDAWAYYPAGFYQEATEQDPTIILRSEQTHQLIRALDEAGWIQPRLDERLRAEDLKITHRLLDIIQDRKSK